MAVVSIKKTNGAKQPPQTYLNNRVTTNILNLHLLVYFFLACECQSNHQHCAHVSMKKTSPWSNPPWSNPSWNDPRGTNPAWSEPCVERTPWSRETCAQVPTAHCILVCRRYKSTAVVQVPAARVEGARWVGRGFHAGANRACQSTPSQ